MDLKQIEYFVRVADLGSFSRAAMVLSVTQPALSKQIRNLEVELGQTLLNRTGRGITLSEEGRILLEHAKTIIDQVERARLAMASTKHSPLGKVVIAVPTITGRVLASGFIAAFRARFPRASLEIIEGRSRVIQEWLLMGRVDIGILYDPSPSPALDIATLKSHDLMLFSLASRSAFQPGKQVQFRDLARIPLILPSAPHSIRRMMETEAAKAGIKLSVVLQIEGASLVIELIQQGHGCSVLPGFSLTRTSSAKRLQLNEIVAPRLTRTLKLAVSHQRPFTHLVRQTVGLLKEHLGPDSDL